MEADIDQNVVAIEDVEGEDERMLYRPQIGDNVGVESSNYCGYADKNQAETELCVCVCVCVCVLINSLVTVNKRDLQVLRSTRPAPRAQSKGQRRPPPIPCAVHLGFA